MKTTTKRRPFADADVSMRMARAMREAPLDELEQETLVKDRSVEVRLRLAKRSDLLPAIVERLAFDKNRRVAVQAIHHCAHPGVLAKLALATLADTRMRAAMNARLPIDVRLALTRDESARVRREALRRLENPSTELLAELSRHPLLRRSMADRKDLPKAMLVEIAKGVDVGARCVAAKNPKLPDEALPALAIDPDAGVRDGVARREGLPIEILRILASDAAFGVRKSIAKKRFVDDEILAKLAEDSDKLVRMHVAMRDGLRPELRAKLALDRSPAVASAAKAFLSGFCGHEKLAAVEAVSGNPKLAKKIAALFA